LYQCILINPCSNQRSGYLRMYDIGDHPRL
jgi:hypothetical protein